MTQIIINLYGLNPFVYKDPIKSSLAVSAILKQMYLSEFDTSNNFSVTNSNNAVTSSLVNQAIENLVILLKEVYPKVNEGSLPNLEDLLNMLNDFSLVEKMAKILEQDEESSSKYGMQLTYFKKNFYKDGENTNKMQELVNIAIAQIESLLRHPGIKTILCNRYNNINYDNVLKNGEVIFVCTRRGDLGAAAQKAFGLFFLLLMQQSVLSRPGNEKTRIPHFLYIDEFPPFITRATEDIFTLYRKYRVGTIISAQNLSQFGAEKEAERTSFRQTLLANCTTKIVFGNNTPEDNDWWRLEFGDKREWDFKQTYKTKNNGEPEYDENYRDIKWVWKKNFEAGKVQSLKFKQIIYKTKDLKGKNIIGRAKIDFLEARYKEPQKIKTYNFSKFIQGISTTSNDKDFSELDSNIDGPIVHNPYHTFEKNRTKTNYIDPIKLNSNLSQAIDDYNNSNNNNNN